MGRLFIYLWSEFPVPEWFEQSKFGKLRNCTQCSGTWIYSSLFIIFGVDILEILGLPSVQIIGGILSGGIVSFLMNLLELGWREKFMTITIE